MKSFIFSLLLAFYSLGIVAQSSSTPECWYNMDPKDDKLMGVSSNKTYQELLQDREAKPVVIAIIDGGTDIYHEDLQGIIWVNEGEIPDNGIDDDKNGYIDDIHGWNFIGNSEGENIVNANMEVTRIYRLLDTKYASADSTENADNEEYKLYLECKKTVEKEVTNAEKLLETLYVLEENLHFADSIMSIYFGTTEYTEKDLKSVKSSKLQSLTDFLLYWREKGITVKEVKEEITRTETKFKYRYNINFNPREIIGDDWTKNDNPYYGNNEVKGDRAHHGTAVAGNVAALRNNGIGVDGVANNAILMIIRVVPDGDEYDKDVANAILYAVHNGASIINLSFGKEYSPQKHFVDSALRIANDYDVLIVHAAGNDASNNDEVENFPLNYDDNGNPINSKFLVVGASTKNKGKDLVAPFSNYGQKTVDLFAPGMRIYSCKPENKYSYSDGTSMASPIAAGVACIIRSYFPELTAEEVKEILMLSVTKYDKKVWVPNSSYDKKSREKKKFSTLSVSGGIINAYNAVKLAMEKTANN
ncbi:MAG TPA: peptidase S8 [Bacteroidetes bacterium]|nr:peptidase S8 [Bacteroidota bacterium]